MGHFFEFVVELLFGFAKHNPDKMPDDITYHPKFLVKHPAKKNIARIFATLMIIAVFSLLAIIVKDDTRFLFVIFIFLGIVLLILSFISFSFRCSVTEDYIKSSYWGLFSKHIKWNKVQCVKVIEQTDEKTVIIAVYNEEGKCVIDLNTDMDYAWHVVKMAEVKNIMVKYEKDLSLKEISHL